MKAGVVQAALNPGTARRVRAIVTTETPNMAQGGLFAAETKCDWP
jgi:hypothetical protein